MKSIDIIEYFLGSPGLPSLVDKDGWVLMEKFWSLEAVPIKKGSVSYVFSGKGCYHLAIMQQIAQSLEEEQS